jgi:hypothetical protein
MSTSDKINELNKSKTIFFIKYSLSTIFQFFSSKCDRKKAICITYQVLSSGDIFSILGKLLHLTILSHLV